MNAPEAIVFFPPQESILISKWAKGLAAELEGVGGDEVEDLPAK